VGKQTSENSVWNACLVDPARNGLHPSLSSGRGLHDPDGNSDGPGVKRRSMERWIVDASTLSYVKKGERCVDRRLMYVV